MDPGRKFSAGTLIYAWRHAPFPPGLPPPPPPSPLPPPNNDTRPSVAEEAAPDGVPVDARLAPFSLSPPPLPQSQPPPRPSRFHMSEVGVGVLLGFGAAILLLFVVCLFMWTSRRKRRMLTGLCKEGPPDKSKGN